MLVVVVDVDARCREMCEVVDVVDVVDVMDDVGAGGLRERCIDEWEGDAIFEVAVVCLGED